MIRVDTLRLYERPLVASVVPGAPPPGLELGVWDSPALPAWAAGWWHPEADRRFRDGQACAVARDEAAAVVAYCWLALTPTPVAEIDRVIVPGPGEVYLYDAFTAPAWRGRGLFTTLLLHLLAHARARGRRRALIFVLARNQASRRAIERAGFQLFQTVSRVELLGLQFRWPRGPWPRSSRVTLARTPGGSSRPSLAPEPGAPSRTNPREETDP